MIKLKNTFPNAPLPSTLIKSNCSIEISEVLYYFYNPGFL